MGIGERIKERRRELRLSVRDLAEKVGIAPSTLYGIERGDQSRSTRLHVLCKVLGLNLEWVDSGQGLRLVDEDARAEPRGAVAKPGRSLPIKAALEVAAAWERIADPTLRSVTRILIESLAEPECGSNRSRK
jgi:transcriptional regulator with XRE-family HTH domain